MSPQIGGTGHSGPEVFNNILVGNKLAISADSITSTDLVDPIVKVEIDPVTQKFEPKMPQKITIKELVIENNGIRSQGRGKFKDSDIEIESENRGLILTADDNTKWLIWVDNTGSLFTTQVAASPEVSFNERVNRINTKKSDLAILRTRKSSLDPGNLQERIGLLEDLVETLIK